MGAFFTNLQARANDPAAVAAALEPLLGADLAWMSRSQNGWVSIYPESTEGQDARVLEGLASGLSATLGAPVLGILIHDSDVLHLWAFANGALVDEYDSNPDYFEEVSPEDRARLQGCPEILAGLGPAGTSAQAIAEALAGRGIKPAADDAQIAAIKSRLEARLEQMKKTQPKLARQFEGQVAEMLEKLAGESEAAFVEGRLEALATALGIEPARAMAGYRDIEAHEATIADLVLLPEATAARRRARRRSEDRRRTTRRAQQQRDGELLWAHELAAGKSLDPLVRPLGFTRDGNFWLTETPSLSSAPPALVVVDPTGREIHREPHEGLLWTSMSADGCWLGTIQGLKAPVRIRATSGTGATVELPPTPRGVGAVHLSHDGAYAAIDDFDGTLSLYETASGTLIRRIDIRGTNVRSCGWSPDARRFVRIDRGQVISLTVRQDEPDLTIDVARHGLLALAAGYLPDSRRVLVAGDGGAGLFKADGKIERRLSWSMDATERLEGFERMARQLSAHGSKTTGALLAQSQPQLPYSGRAVVATDAWLAVLGADGVVRFWRANDGDVIARRDTQQALHWDLVASATGDAVVTGGNPVLCWRAPFAKSSQA